MTPKNTHIVLDTFQALCVLSSISRPIYSCTCLLAQLWANDSFGKCYDITHARLVLGLGLGGCRGCRS